MCFLPADIPITIGGLHFYAIRIIAIVSLGKLWLGSKPPKYKFFNLIDNLFISYNLIGFIAYVIASVNKSEAFIYTLGETVDTIFVYLVFRYILQSSESIKLAIKTFCYCIIALLPFVVFEYFTSNNLFPILFGSSMTEIRDGEIRAAATFSHAILFGSFSASVFPALWSEYKTEKQIKYLLASICCVFYIIACSSSSPIVAFAGVVSLLCLFKWKHHSKKLFFAVILATLFIHFARDAPIWQFLYVRIPLKASSTGWHRYLLVEAALREFSKWWLVGYGDMGADWHIKYWPYAHATFTDFTNHYLLLGAKGGVFAMATFIALCYKTVKATGSLALRSKNDQWLWWGLTTMMISHCISFLSVAYFGQITMLLYFNIAIGSYAYSLLKQNQVNEAIQRNTSNYR